MNFTIKFRQFLANFPRLNTRPKPPQNSFYLLFDIEILRLSALKNFVAKYSLLLKMKGLMIEH
jgi:hypothetical protein